MELTVIAWEVGDEKSTTQTQVTIALIDLNDNKPKFNSDAYKFTISPKTTSGSSLSLISPLGGSIRVFDLDKVTKNKLKKVQSCKGNDYMITKNHYDVKLTIF